MKKKSIYFIFLLIVIVYACLVAFFLINNKKEQYLFLSKNTLLVYKNKEWIKTNKKEVKNMKTYSGSKYEGDFDLKTTDFFYHLFDAQNRRYENYTAPILSYTNNLKLKVTDFEIANLNDEDYKILDKVLQYIGIEGYSNLSSFEKLSFDFNEDGTKEILYAVSNTFIEDTYQQVFSVVYMVNGNSFDILYQEKGMLDHTYEIGRVYFHSVVDMDSQKGYELIFGSELFDEGGTHYQVYNFKNGIPVLLYDIK